MNGTRAEPQMQALERWRQMQLETAQAHCAELHARAEQHRAVVARCTRRCADTREWVRRQLHAAQALAPDELLRWTQFAAVQARELRLSEVALLQAQAAADTARQAVKTCFEELAVVRKWRARRSVQLRQFLQRQQQRMLDERAAAQPPPL